MAYIKDGMGAYGAASNEPFFPFSSNTPAKSDGCGCGGTCGGCGDDHGMGFFTSMDPSTWGIAEWGTVAAVGYVGAKALASHPALKRGRKKAGSAASKATSSLGSIALLAGAAYGAYWLYQQYGSSVGLGDYMAQGYTGPQILAAPLSSATVQIPAGW
jgi:hypothetical protein